MTHLADMVFDNSAFVESDANYKEQIERIKSAPKVYKYTFFNGKEVYSTSILARDDADCERLFWLLCGENAPNIMIESREYCGVVEFCAPNLFKHFRSKIGMDIQDKFYGSIRAEAEALKQKEENEKNKKRALNAKRKEHERNALIDKLRSTLSWAEKVTGGNK
jgi:hypothetical protein